MKISREENSLVMTQFTDWPPTCGQDMTLTLQVVHRHLAHKGLPYAYQDLFTSLTPRAYGLPTTHRK
jgi:hypothetical protein